MTRSHAAVRRLFSTSASTSLPAKRVQSIHASNRFDDPLDQVQRGKEIGSKLPSSPCLRDHRPLGAKLEFLQLHQMALPSPLQGERHHSRAVAGNDGREPNCVLVCTNLKIKMRQSELPAPAPAPAYPLPEFTGPNEARSNAPQKTIQCSSSASKSSFPESETMRCSPSSLGLKNNLAELCFRTTTIWRKSSIPRSTFDQTLQAEPETARDQCLGCRPS